VRKTTLTRSLVCVLCAWPALAQEPVYRRHVSDHFDRFLDHGLDTYGEDHSTLWIASFDVAKGGLPERPLPARPRWYREITSPAGSNLYWDQPALVAAMHLSRLSGSDRYHRAVTTYLRDFLDRCVSPVNGLFLWGNHAYYDVKTDRPVRFSGGYHECRPHTPAWELLWQVDARATERAIRALGDQHVKEPASGRFCRHANPDNPPGTHLPGEREAAMPFLEAGAVLVESMVWLARKKGGDDDLAALALRVAEYSLAQRDPATGLVRNQPAVKRWDYQTCTTEVGLWAGSLLRAEDALQQPRFHDLAQLGVRPYLRHGFDEASGRYWGGLDVSTGQPREEVPRVFSPPRHAEIFDPAMRPTHNYPIPMAAACLGLLERDPQPMWQEAVARWIGHIRRSLPANGGAGAAAEDYGRVILFLWQAARVLDQEMPLQLAREVADEAIRVLWVPEHRMFRSHPGEDRCDAVDSPGILLLALLQLDHDEPLELFGLGL
jgi:hypothetical protein